jgi:gamma-glutamylcyclotransferase (GGCT)/AIG2-like uncharacterized protein YtfP
MTGLSVNQRSIDELFVLKTGSYRPSGWGTGLPILTLLGLPYFTVRRVEQMKYDPDVRLGMALKYAPTLTVKFSIEAREDVAELYRKEISTSWYYIAPRILESFWYSRAGGEAIFKLDENEDQVHLAGVRDVYPADISILTSKSSLAGIKVSAHGSTGMGGSTFDDPTHETDDLHNKGVIDLFSPKSFVYVHHRRFGGWNGQSDLLGCYSDWLDKWDEKGARAIRRMWFQKNAFSGYFIQHPPHDYTWTDANGVQQRIPYRDLARVLVEQLATGGVVGVPAMFDPDTKQPMWRIEQPALNGDAEGLHNYLRELRAGILHGLEIPDDIVSSVSGTGSFAGRTIPFRAYIMMCQLVLRELAAAFKEQLWAPIAMLNFGKVDADIKVEVDIDRLMPSSPMGDQASGPDAIDRADATEGGDTRSRKKKAVDQKQFSLDKLRPRHRKIFAKAAGAFYGYAGTDVRFEINGRPVDSAGRIVAAKRPRISMFAGSNGHAPMRQMAIDNGKSKRALPLFVFGTLKDGSLMRKVVGHDVSYLADSIEGYKHREDGEGYSDLEPDEGSEVAGFRVNLSADDLAKVDEWEDQWYKRVAVVLESGLAAWAYWPREGVKLP